MKHKLRVFLDEERALLEAVKLIAFYFSESEVRPTIARWPFRMACRLFLLRADLSHNWTRPKDWMERLWMAGLDPRTFEVIDRDRWALTWQQLCEDQRFSPTEQVKRLAAGELVVNNIIEDRYRYRTARIEEIESPEVKSTISDYLPTDLKARLRRRKKL